jgi:ComF family protein
MSALGRFAAVRAGAPSTGWPRLWPSRCLICAEPCADDVRDLMDHCLPVAADLDLCRACRDALPRNRSACARCALPLPIAAAACGHCLRRPPAQAATFAAFVYAPPLDRLLPRMKFHHDLAAGRLLAALMAQALAEVERPQALIALPLHRLRLRARGYDQALELAKPLARSLHLPLLRDTLHRHRDTAPQSRLDAAERRRNLRDAFVVAPRAFLPAHVALIDDVMTTGASVHSAATALLRAGVARVDVWVCARVK